MELSVLPKDTEKPSIIPESLGLPHSKMDTNIKKLKKRKISEREQVPVWVGDLDQVAVLIGRSGIQFYHIARMWDFYIQTKKCLFKIVYKFFFFHDRK